MQSTWPLMVRVDTNWKFTPVRIYSRIHFHSITFNRLTKPYHKSYSYMRKNVVWYVSSWNLALHITVTSYWAQWGLKSTALRLFTQPFSQAQIKENIKSTRHWPLCGEFTGEFPAQMASTAGNVSTWWRHHDRLTFRLINSFYKHCRKS